MKRNTMFAGLSLVAAGAAIGAGAMVSSNAMADSAGAVPTDQLTMLSIGPDGEAIQCTFEGAEVEGLLPDLPPGAWPDGATGSGDIVVGTGEIQPVDGSLPELVISGSAQMPAGATEMGVAVIGESPAGVPAGVPLQAFNADDAREGSPEECAALHDDAVDAAAQIADGGGQLITTGVIAGSASVVSEP